MNRPDIQHILTELYVVDPSLQKEEAQLRSLLEKMLRVRPDVKIDQAFAQNLKQKLLSTPLKQNNFISYFSAMFKKPLFVAGAATLGVALLVSVSFLKNDTSPEYARLDTRTPTLSLAGELPRNAFGPLVTAANGAVAVSAPLGSPEAMSGNFSGDRQGGSTMPSALMAKDVAVSEPTVAVGNNPVSSVMPMQDKMIAPYYSYNYKYTGEPITLADTELPVFRRVKDTDIARAFAQSFLGRNNGMLDLSRFDDAVLQNFQIAQNKKDGYLINVDLVNGTVNINPQYERWYTPCSTGNCESPTPLTEKDIPSNDRIIAIANDFLEDFGIAREQYGAPVVDENWKNNYPMPFAMEGGVRTSLSMYIPDVMVVTYPLIVEGQKITETNGQEFGLRVNVDIRKMKGQGLWNLYYNKYEKSNYATETDTARILKIAENGGNGWYQEVTENIRTLNLGTPEKIYMPHYQYVPESGMSTELYVPALKFPVLNIPTDQPYFYQKFIIVPLVKEILPQYEPQPGQPPVGIMPLTKDIISPSAREMEVRN